MLVKKITKVEPKKVFAIKTSTHTFIADGLLHHNCSHCNLWLRGNTLEYRKGMVKKYGEEITKEIEDNYNKPLPINFDPRTFLEEKIQYYKSLDSLENHGIQKTM